MNAWQAIADKLTFGEICLLVRACRKYSAKVYERTD